MDHAKTWVFCTHLCMNCPDANSVPPLPAHFIAVRAHHSQNPNHRSKLMCYPVWQQDNHQPGASCWRNPEWSSVLNNKCCLQYKALALQQLMVGLGDTMHTTCAPSWPAYCCGN